MVIYDCWSRTIHLIRAVRQWEHTLKRSFATTKTASFNFSFAHCSGAMFSFALAPYYWWWLALLPYSMRHCINAQPNKHWLELWFWFMVCRGFLALYHVYGDTNAFLSVCMIAVMWWGYLQHLKLGFIDASSPPDFRTSLDYFWVG